MSLTVTPHLNFRGQARDALGFYGKVFGAEPMLVTYGMAGQADAAASPDDVMWGQVAADDGFRIMAYDVQADRVHEAGANAFYLSLRASSADEARARWAALAEGGLIRQPLGPSQWSELYGMLEDRFGTIWIVDVEPAA